MLLHLPMEPKQGKPEWLGPGAILSRMSDEEVRTAVEKAIDNVPYAKGINNHMGSKITGDERIMAVILDVCRERGLLFVDSKTNYRSVTAQISEKKGMPNLYNDIFLDDVHSSRHIAGQLRKVQEFLDKKGQCVAIGHVGINGKLTAATLKQSLPEFQAKGVKFIGISELAYEGPSVGPGRGVTLP
ncbi:divergent polysaccharide deacetylase [Fontibacillus phaseoli]|uniref:Divergent polysaccharide deacetylase n=1 Tax=Fontibacillus phaseoli TaxID=1416533 RepID=A0A369BM62_9BACL|nr:divergent polysaccharide deacetylase [Fontibacillus phaseoli]